MYRPAIFLSTKYWVKTTKNVHYLHIMPRSISEALSFLVLPIFQYSISLHARYQIISDIKKQVYSVGKKYELMLL